MVDDTGIEPVTPAMGAAGFFIPQAGGHSDIVNRIEEFILLSLLLAFV